MDTKSVTAREDIVACHDLYRLLRSSGQGSSLKPPIDNRDASHPAIDPVEQVIRVVIDDREVRYDWSEADELMHAFAISIHRSQGAEFPAVVIPIMMQHYMMLQRNLLYTAITRAKELVVLVGMRKAIYMAVRNDRPAHRYSGLAWRLNSPAE